MPSPIETEFRVHDSPVPTHTVSWCDGSTASAPIDCTDCLSNTGLNVVPPSSDFQTPPDAAPAYTIVLPRSTNAATADTRPLISAEPMLRAPIPEMTPASSRTSPPPPEGGAPDGGLAAASATIVFWAFAPAAGNRKTASSTSTFGSAVVRAM